jgi:beta-lactamase regulating signal transducer with metallopeptidase domain
LNPLWHALASEEWAQVVHALLHTLWLGGLVAGGLYFVLRGKANPVTRYRWCVSALLAVVLGGIIAWALLAWRPNPLQPMTVAVTPAAVAPPAGKGYVVSPLPTAAATPRPRDAARAGLWTPWLALSWLGGLAAMLARAGALVAEAEALRQRSRPLANEAVLHLIEEAQRKLGLVRRVRVVVTEQLTSPAVMGWLTPVLILPISLVTTLPMGDIQLILLHELAHIRRGDYLVNLCQLLAESLLFFNPAVWWISRQIRQEREACCDAMAIALAGDPVQYARTLAQVAGAALAAAPAFGDRRHPSSLKDRIQRLLVPGYRPAWRPTWSALLAAFFVGGGLLFLSALGTRVTVAAILSPQERIARLEEKMTELGESPATMNFQGDWGKIPNITVSGRIRMADGRPAPEWLGVEIVSVVGQSSAGQMNMVRNGFFSNSVPAGTIYIGAELTNCAPVALGPLVGNASNKLENLELVLDPGFEATIQLVDAVSGQPVAGGKLAAQFWLRGVRQTSFYPRALTSGADGSAVLSHAADLPLIVTVNAPGYEIVEQRFESVPPGKPLRIALHPGAKVSGRVLDKATGRPIPGATVRVHFEAGQTQRRGYGWDDASRILATTDENGRFAASQLRQDTIYWLGVSAPGHESVVLNSVHPGATLEARLGPELVVNGRVTGNLDRLAQAWNGEKQIDYSLIDDTADDHNSLGCRAPVLIKDGVGYFQFTNPAAGRVQISVAGSTIERTVDAPLSDWLIDLDKLSNPAATNPAGDNFPKREVVFRFQVPSGPPPQGTVSVTLQNHAEIIGHMAHVVEMELTNGEVQAEMDIGGGTSVEARRMVGYWLNRAAVLWVPVTNGPGPMVIEVPLLPAGALYASARNADGTPAYEVFFGVSELKRAPGRDDQNGLDIGGSSVAVSAPRKWISGPLPLGGTYQVYAWRGNAFGTSQPVKLTGEKPDAEVELQFPPGRTFDGVVLDPDGKPIAQAELRPEFRLSDGHSFGLQPVSTDADGRFHLEDTTPGLGDYSVQATAPGAMTEILKLHFGSQPQTIRLQRGRSLGGRVVQAGTGYAIPDAEVRALDYDREELPMVTTRTDGEGRFQFASLGDVKYTFYVNGATLVSNQKFRADGSTNLVLSVQINEGSQVKPRAPQ